MGVEKAAMTLMSPEIQYGFAAMCLILIGVLCWLIHSFIRIIQNGTHVVEENSNVIKRLGESLGDNQVVVSDELRRLTTEVEAVKNIILTKCAGRGN